MIAPRNPCTAQLQAPDGFAIFAETLAIVVDQTHTNACDRTSAFGSQATRLFVRCVGSGVRQNAKWASFRHSPTLDKRHVPASLNLGDEAFGNCRASYHDDAKALHIDRVLGIYAEQVV